MGQNFASLFFNTTFDNDDQKDDQNDDPLKDMDDANGGLDS